MMSILYSVIGVLLLLAVLALYTQTTLFAKPTGTYQTRIAYKDEKQTVVYTGVFIPLKIYTVITSDDVEIKVERNQYNRIKIGDTVTVTSYSNGLHKLEV